MHKSLSLLVVLSSIAACVAPSDSGDALATDDLATDDRGLISLARFETDRGTSIEFVASPELGEVGYLESTPVGGDERSLFDGRQELSVLDRYLELAGDHAAVPELLVELSPAVDTSRANERELVDIIEGTTKLIDTRPVVLAAASGGSCGSDGANYFRNNHCDLSGSARFSPIRSCNHNYNGGNSVWFSIKTSTGSARRWSSFARIAVCTSAGAYTDHRYRKANGSWKTAHHVHGAAYTIQTSKWNGGSKRRREIRSARNGGSGGLRSYTSFTNLL